MNLKRMYPKTPLKGGMSLLELSVVMTSFLLFLTITMIGAAALKEGAGRSDDGSRDEQAPRRVRLPAQIADSDASGLSSLVRVG